MGEIKNVSVEAAPLAPDEREMVLQKLSVAAAEALRSLDEGEPPPAGFDYQSLVAPD